MRVLLGSVPRLLASILEEAALDWPDVEIVATTDATDLTHDLDQLDPDVLLLGLNGEESLESQIGLLRTSPRLRVLGITPDGRRVSVLELRPQISELGNLSPAELFGAIRAGGGW